MKKQLLIVSTLLVMSTMLSACFDGGSSDTPANETGDRSNFNPADFTVSQLNTLSQSSDAQVKVELNNLATDDAVYVSVSSDDVENAKLKLSPSKTILNPNKGAASFVVSAKDLGVSSAPQITLLITTSGNTSMEQTKTIEWSN